jgi:hypothetical protein
MGWMHDTLEFMQRDPMYRNHHLNEISFGLVYAFSENFVLPLSHDEVVHGKGSLIEKMPGGDREKFANLRLLFGHMFGHPGKKLLFRGRRVRAVARVERRDVARLASHAVGAARRHAAAGGRLQPALSRAAGAARARRVGRRLRSGSSTTTAQRGVRVGALRRAARDHAIVACNYSGVRLDGYRSACRNAGAYRELLNTDAGDLRRRQRGQPGRRSHRPVPMHGREHSLALDACRRSPRSTSHRSADGKRLEAGSAYPLGATWDGTGVNFALFSAHAERVDLCIFDARGRREIARYTLPEYTDEVWHGYLPGCGRARSTATASTDRTIRRTATASTTTSCCSIRTRKRTGRCAGATRTTATASARRAPT